MNKTYRSIYNESLGAWVAVSENDTARGKNNCKSVMHSAQSASTVMLGKHSLAVSALAMIMSTVFGGLALFLSQSTALAACTFSTGGSSSVTVTPSGSDTAASCMTALTQKVMSDELHYYSVKSTDNNAGSNYQNDGATGNNALAIGPKAKAVGESSVALGNGAVANADRVIAIGKGAAPSSATNFPNDSIAIGSYAAATTALQPTARAFTNIAIGLSAGQNVGGNSNIAMGEKAGTNLINNTDDPENKGTVAYAQWNIAIGSGAGSDLSNKGKTVYDSTGKVVSMPAAHSNIAIGKNAGNKIVGMRNTAVGPDAGNTVAGESNVALGFNAGNTVAGNNNVGILGGGSVTGKGNTGISGGNTV